MEFVGARRPRPVPVGARAGVTTILVTACGAPGAARLLRALRENGEREIRLVGVDMSERAIGRHLCDTFHLVPPGADPTFPDALLKLVEQEGVDVVLPESSHDLHHLAPRRGEFPVPVMICGPEAEQRSNDKGETFAAMQRIGVGAPGLPPRDRRGRRRGGRARARLPGSPGLLQAGLLLRLAGLPRARSERRPHAPAPQRAPRRAGDAARGGGRAAAGGRPRPARDGVPDRARADGRRDRGRQPHRPAGHAHARVGALRPRHVLRHARRAASSSRRPSASSPSSGSSGSSASSSWARR